MWGVSMRICACAHVRTLIFILLITNNTTRFFEKNFLREKMIFLRKNYFRKGLKLCAYAHGYPPIYFFFIYILFSDVRFPPFCRFFFAVWRLFAGCFGAVCVVFSSVFFWVFVCCFLIPGLYRGLFGDFGLFCGIFLMLAKMKGVSVNLCKSRAFRV